MTETPIAVCAPQGFLAAGVTAGIKKSGRPDLALILSVREATSAGAFTTNKAAAASVIVSRERVAGGACRGVVINSGCANALTGALGLANARGMAEVAAKQTNIDADEMLVCSTGAIGVQLPMSIIEPGIRAAAQALSTNDAEAVKAIMTTDTRPKTFARTQQGWTVGAMAKGAGMIAPDMATMIAIITTDAHSDHETLSSSLHRAIDSTFNCITVDGDTSTNDTVLVFANGASGVTPSAYDLDRAILDACSSLATQIVRDGEGSTKVIEVMVEGARDEREARAAARSVAESLLVKTAVFGGDPNWGRVAAALGRSGAAMVPENLSISVGGTLLLSKGTPDNAPLDAARAALKSDTVAISCDLGAGGASAKMMSCDLTPRYVELNAEYET